MRTKRETNSSSRSTHNKRNNSNKGTHSSSNSYSSGSSQHTKHPLRRKSASDWVLTKRARFLPIELAGLARITFQTTRTIGSGGRLLPGHLGALFARFGKSNRDRLLAARYPAAFPAFAGSKSPALFAVQGALHAPAGRFTVSCHQTSP